MHTVGKVGFCLLFALVPACALVSGVDFDEARRDESASAPDAVPAPQPGASSGLPSPVQTGSGIEPIARLDASVPRPDAPPPVPGITIPCYPDADGDGVPASSMPLANATTCPAGTTTRAAPLDCDDRDTNAKPGQTEHFGTPRVGGGFDYNCNNTVEWSAINPAGEVRSNADENCNSIRTREACENTVRVADVDAAQCGRDLNVNVCRWFAVQCGKSLTTETMRIVCR